MTGFINGGPPGPETATWWLEQCPRCGSSFAQMRASASDLAVEHLTPETRARIEEQIEITRARDGPQPLIDDMTKMLTTTVTITVYECGHCGGRFEFGHPLPPGAIT